jgi:transcriptional regulator with XRE-family HTH domain
MSLKKAFASVLKAMRATRTLSQKNLAEVSSRTYISKLERGQCSPTLEMITSLSSPLRVSPLTLIALTIGAESGQSIKTLVSRLESELTELASAGVLDNLDIPLATSPTQKQNASSPKTKYPASSFQQAELCFAD